MLHVTRGFHGDVAFLERLQLDALETQAWRKPWIPESPKLRSTRPEFRSIGVTQHYGDATHEPRTHASLQAAAVGHADTSSFGGRPPFAPFAFAAAALALVFRCPPRRPVAAANRRVPKARSTKPGT